MASAINATFDNVAVCVTDLGKSIQWCRDVLGFEPTYRTYIDTIEAEFVIMDHNDLRLELLHGRNTQPGEVMIPGPHLSSSGIKAIVFRVADLEAVTAQLERQSIPLVWKLERTSSDGLRATMIRYPDGTLINILQYPAAH